MSDFLLLYTAKTREGLQKYEATPQTQSYLQTIFNRAWTGLKAQEFLQSVKNNTCAYRGQGGRKCGIGHCIDDRYYRETFEGSLFTDSDIIDAVRLSLGMSVTDPRVFLLLNHVQSAHDRYPDPTDMQSNLRMIASDYKLTVPA